MFVSAQHQSQRHVLCSELSRLLKTVGLLVCITKPAALPAQVMDRSQLPALTSTTMLVQAALSTPISARAKQSVKARNTVLVGGILTMVAANAAFALIPAVWGAPARITNHVDHNPDFLLLFGNSCLCSTALRLHITPEAL